MHEWLLALRFYLCEEVSGGASSNHAMTMHCMYCMERAILNWSRGIWRGAFYLQNQWLLLQITWNSSIYQNDFLQHCKRYFKGLCIPWGQRLWYTFVCLPGIGNYCSMLAENAPTLTFMRIVMFHMSNSFYTDDRLQITVSKIETSKETLFLVNSFVKHKLLHNRQSYTTLQKNIGLVRACFWINF